jgi:hypothetical protein
MTGPKCCTAPRTVTAASCHSCWPGRCTSLTTQPPAGLVAITADLSGTRPKTRTRCPEAWLITNWPPSVVPRMSGPMPAGGSRGAGVTEWNGSMPSFSEITSCRPLTLPRPTANITAATSAARARSRRWRPRATTRSGAGTGTGALATPENSCSSLSDTPRSRAGITAGHGIGNLQSGRELGASPRQPCLDAARRAPQLGRDLIDRHIGQVVQYQHRALSFGQGAQASDKGNRIGADLWDESSCREAAPGGRGGPGAPPPANGEIRRDASYPGLRRAAIPDGRPALPGAREGFLRDILSVVEVASQCESVPDDPGRAGRVELVK